MHLEDWPRSHPDRPAIVMGRGEVVTYGQLDERASRLEHLLQEYGLQPGDVVAVFSENTARYHEVTWAARRSGFYFATVNSHLLADELAYILNDCGAKVLVASGAQPELAAIAGAMTSDVVPTVAHRLAIGGSIPGFDDYDETVDAANAGETGALPRSWEGDLLQYSSGTTGRPKGIKRALVAKPKTLEDDLLVAFLNAIELPLGATYLAPAPLYHSAPIMWSMGVHRLGGTIVVMERFDAIDALRLIEKHHITHGQFVPTMFVRMLKLPEAERLSYDLSSLRTVVHAAAPCPVEVKRQMIEWWGPVISEYWSSSEGAGATFITSADWLEHPGSVGRAFGGQLHICDAEGRELPTGESGQIWAEGSQDFRYLNDEGKTAEAHDPRGWTSVGDIGRLDEQGYLYLTDRKAFMIISGGVNIYPQEAENVLIGHPQVMDVAVIGVPHEDFGEEVRGVVQPIDWADVGPDLESELVAYCRANLSAFKCPRRIDFVRELPRLDTGKLYKKKLQQQYRDEYEAARGA